LAPVCDELQLLASLLQAAAAHIPLPERRQDLIRLSFRFVAYVMPHVACAPLVGSITRSRFCQSLLALPLISASHFVFLPSFVSLSRITTIIADRYSRITLYAPLSPHQVPDLVATVVKLYSHYQPLTLYTFFRVFISPY
jgi:hypothetical protein